MLDSAQSQQASSKHLRKSICEMLQDFKYWLVEGSLHEPLKPSKPSHENFDANPPAHKPHRMFREIHLSHSQCDRCRKSAIKYQCTDCAQGYCTDCWPRKQKRGAHLEGIGEQHFDPKCHSVHIRSATSSPDTSSTQTPTGYAPLPHIEEGAFSLSLNV